MIIAWWYSNKFLSLSIILFPFHFIFFTCFPMSPYGDYLSVGDSVSFILFYLLAFQCLHVMIICLPDMDRMNVLVLPGRCWQSVCFSYRDNGHLMKFIKQCFQHETLFAYFISFFWETIVLYHTNIFSFIVFFRAIFFWMWTKKIILVLKNCYY